MKQVRPYPRNEQCRQEQARQCGLILRAALVKAKKKKMTFITVNGLCELMDCSRPTIVNWEAMQKLPKRKPSEHPIICGNGHPRYMMGWTYAELDAYAPKPNPQVRFKHVRHD